MYQVKWISLGIEGIETSKIGFDDISEAISHAKLLDGFVESICPIFAWVEPCPPIPKPAPIFVADLIPPEPKRGLEWEDVMGPELETRTITQETLAMLDRYVADKAPCPMDPIARTQEAVSRLVESGRVSPEADTGWMNYMAELYPDYEQDEADIVDMVATGYEFNCHECGEWTKIPEWTQIVQCNRCCTTFRANDPEHVYEYE